MRKAACLKTQPAQPASPQPVDFLISSLNHQLPESQSHSASISLQCSSAFVLSRVRRVRLCVTVWTVVLQAPRPWGSQGKNLMPCPPLGDLLNPGIKPMSPVSPILQVDSLPLSHWGS